MKVDMSPQAVTNRMHMLDQLWELAVALKSSEIVTEQRGDPDNRDEVKQEPQDDEA